MSHDNDVLQCVKQSRLGDPQSLGRLAEMVQGRLRAYIYRVMLDDHAADDVCQETLLAMMDSLVQLRDPAKFWPWLYRVATSKIQQHYRQAKRMPVHLSGLEDALLVETARQPDHAEGFGKMVRQELSQMILGAMKQLKERHRAVLALRCFDEMPYEDIGQAMGCSALAARVLFVRARQSLQKQLSRRGVSKSSFLLVLVLFGRATAPAQAAEITSVTTAAAAGTAGGITGAAISGSAKVKLAAAGLLTITAGLWYAASYGHHQTDAIHSVHYTFQAGNVCPPPKNSPSGGAFETWCYWPHGPGGTMLVRQQRWNDDMTQKQGGWLQDGHANYFYDPDNNMVYVHNTSVGGFLLMPTDPPEFVEFVLAVGDRPGGIEYERKLLTSLLRHARDQRFNGSVESPRAFEFNTVQAGFFRRYWPEDTEIWDQRDAMHKRGWTGFRIRGQLDGKTVTGRGRLPFVLHAGDKHPAWMTMSIGEDLNIVDTPDGAVISNDKGRSAHYRAGSFFEALARPWMGLTAIDTVRRDAAKRRIRFQTVESDDQRHYDITLARGTGYAQTAVVIAIDAERDVVEGILFSSTGNGQDHQGMIAFEYLDEVSDSDSRFMPPENAVRGDRSLGDLWLMNLADGTLAPDS